MPDQSLFPDLRPADLPISQHDNVSVCDNCRGICRTEDSNENPDGLRYCPECAWCERCHSFFTREDGIHHNGTTYCPDCVYTCDQCGDTSLDEFPTAYDSNRRRNEVCACEECTWTCEDCDSRYTNEVDSIRTEDSRTICQHCYENDYFTCEGCSWVLPMTEYADDGYCNGCHTSDDGENDEIRVIHEHGYKPTPRFLPQVGRACYFGLEIEVDGPYRPRSELVSAAELLPDDSWYAKDDGSLEYGFECVSHPGTWDHWRDDPFNWCGQLVERGLRSYDTQTCGLHIHVTRSFLSESQILKLLMFFRANVDTVTRLSRRKGEQWKGYARIDERDTRQLVKKVKDGPDTRYEAINLENENTVEFRIFRGTLNVQSIKRNLALVVSLCMYVKESKRTQLSFTEFCTWLYRRGAAILGNNAIAHDVYLWVVNAAGGHLPDDDGE